MEDDASVSPPEKAPMTKNLLRSLLERYFHKTSTDLIEPRKSLAEALNRLLEGFRMNNQKQWQIASERMNVGIRSETGKDFQQKRGLLKGSFLLSIF